uniref:Uncharacterized protein n=1 Tax=Lepeophtheirus salmonis TaxID=72036 RepID=A0A0K2VC17_LEPSM
MNEVTDGKPYTCQQDHKVKIVIRAKCAGFLASILFASQQAGPQSMGFLHVGKVERIAYKNNHASISALKASIVNTMRYLDLHEVARH